MTYSDRYNEVNYSIESTSKGCSSDFFISPSSMDIRADISLYSTYDITIWGQLKSRNQLPLSGILIKLIQINILQGEFTCTSMGEITTDSNGFYLFKLTNQAPACYHLVIYSPNSLHNKIINPKFNPCSVHQSNPLLCQRSLLNYLDIHFPSTFGYKHFVRHNQVASIITTVYSIPCYR